MRSVLRYSLQVYYLAIGTTGNTTSTTAGVHWNVFRNLDASQLPGSDLWIFGNGSSPVVDDDGDQDTGEFANAPYGLYVGSGMMYNVQENDFDMVANWPVNYATGFIANKCGAQASTLRKNNFHGNNRAAKFQGDNRNSLSTAGSKYLCNNFDGNMYDIRETASGNGTFNLGVPHQGNSMADPTNTFTYNFLFNPKDDVYNEVVPHFYYRNGTINPRNSEITTSSVIVLPALGFINCTQQINPTSGMVPQNPDKWTDAEANYNTAKLWYDALKDGGQTNALKTQVENTQFATALDTYYQLLAHSPNVSTEVLAEAMAKAEIPNALLAQIMAANPQAAKSEDVKQKLEERSTPFNDYQKEQMDQGLTQASPLEVLSADISHYLYERGEALYYKLDSLGGDTLTPDSIKLAMYMGWLNVNKYANDRLQALDLYAAQCNYTQAIALANTMQNYFVVSHSDAADWPALAHVLSIEQSLRTASTPALSASDLATLENYLNTTSALVSERALALLVIYAGRENEEYIAYEDMQERSFLHHSSTSADTPLQVFPNPANNLLMVLFRPAGLHHLELISADGRLVMQQLVGELASEIAVDVSTLVPGLYHLRLLDAKGVEKDTATFIKE
jgi:hypothetical protein